MTRPAADALGRSGAWKVPRADATLLSRVGALALLLLAVALRAYQLGEPSLWADEANTVGRARLPLADLLAVLAREDTNPPLYYLLLKPWLAWLGDSEVALRSFSVVWGLAALPLAALAGRQQAGRAGAWVAALLAATAPALVIFAQEGRGYTLLAVLGLASFLLLRRALARGRARDWAAYGVVTAASLYVHNLALLWAAWQLAVVLLDGPRRGWPARLRGWALGQGLAYLLYLPWALALLGQVGAFAQGGAWLTAPSPVRLLFTVASLLGGASYHREGDLRPTFGLLHAYLLAGPVLLAYAGARRLPAPDRRALLVLAVVPVFALYVAGHVLPVYVDRAVLLSALGVVLLAAAAFRPPLAPRAGALLWGALALTLALHLGSLATYYAQPRDAYRDLARDVAQAARPGESVLFLPGFGRVAFAYYWDRLPAPDASASPGLDAAPRPGLDAFTPGRPAHLLDLDGAARPDDATLARLSAGLRAVWIVRVAAPPPEAAADLPARLEGLGLRRLGLRRYPDDLLTLELYAADPTDTHGLAW